jgi:FtsZ-interacting cell division protein ZipA
VLPIVIIAAIAIPLVVIGFFAARRSTKAGEHPVTETAADRRRTEEEFAEAEEYQAEWREEQHKHPHDTTL